MTTRKEMRLQIPYGYGKKIASRAGVTPRFVSKYLNNSNINSEKVEIATLEILAELANKKKLVA